MSVLYSSDLSILKAFEEGYAAIKEEYVNYLNKHILEDSAATRFEWEGAVGSGIELYDLKSTGNNITKHKQLFSATHNILQSINECVVKRATISTIGPGTKIKLHNDINEPVFTFRNKQYHRWRCHLGIDIPDSCFFLVNFKKVLWEEGKAFCFNLYDLHSAVNNNKNRSRTVLLVDFLFTRSPV